MERRGISYDYFYKIYHYYCIYYVFFFISIPKKGWLTIFIWFHLVFLQNNKNLYGCLFMLIKVFLFINLDQLYNFHGRINTVEEVIYLCYFALSDISFFFSEPILIKTHIKSVIISNIKHILLRTFIFMGAFSH